MKNILLTFISATVFTSLFGQVERPGVPVYLNFIVSPQIEYRMAMPVKSEVIPSLGFAATVNDRLYVGLFGSKSVKFSDKSNTINTSNPDLIEAGLWLGGTIYKVPSYNKSKFLRRVQIGACVQTGGGRIITGRESGSENRDNFFYVNTALELEYYITPFTRISLGPVYHNPWRILEDYQSKEFRGLGFNVNLKILVFAQNYGVVRYKSKIFSPKYN